MNKVISSVIVVMSVLAITTVSCKKDDPVPETNTGNGSGTAPQLVFKFRFDSTQLRLDNLGNPATIPAGRSAYSPKFNSMSTNYIEFTPNQLTAVGDGEVVYNGPVTTAGGSTAIDFTQTVIAEEGDVIHSMPLSDVTPGTYEWVRTSLAYQNYDIPAKYLTYNVDVTIASFVGFNTYIESFTVFQQEKTVNAEKLQGYWVAETHPVGAVVPPLSEGQAPAGATTVPNPLFATSPIPAGSCIVTGQFGTPLTITGNETEDIVITLSVSTNNSFEFIDDLMDGIYEPLAGDTVVDMGVRGLIPYVNL